MLGSMSGRIITFYSYKGGAGRTMAAANMAWILASNGRRVLLIDWDLESPGLHRYLSPFLADPDLTRTPGLIDFACEAGSRKSPSLMDYIVQVNFAFSGGGAIDFLGAGRQDENYHRRVNTFSWDDFYRRQDGHRLLQAERNRLKADYDYVLIDSRSGASDTAGICTMEMPDLLVVPFTLNHQSIEGSAATAALIRAGRSDLPIFPVPTRIEHAELDKLSAATAFARRMFAPFLLHVQSQHGTIDLKDQAAYWQDVEIPYVAYYAFEEIPAAFKDESGSPRGLLAASERLTSRITDRAVSALRFENNERHGAVLEAFSFNPKPAIKANWVKPAKRSGVLGAGRMIARRLFPYGWPVAAALLACIVYVLQYGQGHRPPQIGALTSQLQRAVEDLSRVQAFAEEPSGAAKFPRGDFAEGYAILQDTLTQLESSSQPSYGSNKQDATTDPSSPIRQRSGAEPLPRQRP
jgi:cellulose biosynthesis protein BcsQ